MAKYALKTKGGYFMDEVTSALQKTIRRGLEKEAMYWAHELYETYPGYLYRRLPIIACEDVGQANLEVVQLTIDICGYLEYMFRQKKGMDICVVGLVVLMLARSQKSRESDDFVNEVIREKRNGWRLDMPDYAVDKHTAAGRARGMGRKEFWEDGAKIENEAYPSKYEGWDPELGDSAGPPDPPNLFDE